MTRRASLYQLILTFFGLDQQYRAKLFSDIHEIVFHGKNYDFWSVYNMPVWLRRITYKRIEKYFADENARIDAQKGVISENNLPESGKMIAPPTVKSKNVYNTGASKN